MASASNPTQVKEIISEHKLHDSDTGSPEVQIALLSGRIEHLTGHLKMHKRFSLVEVCSCSLAAAVVFSIISKT